uniref:Uncharacterized protein n=1 Tax=Zea mays TaxID=4577 RepID=A0A804P3A0_MAIZE
QNKNSSFPLSSVIPALPPVSIARRNGLSPATSPPLYNRPTLPSLAFPSHHRTLQPLPPPFLSKSSVSACVAHKRTAITREPAPPCLVPFQEAIKGAGNKDSGCNGGGHGRGRRGLAVVASGGGRRSRLAGAARGGARGGRAVVAAPAPGGALRGAGRARAAVPVPAGVREGDGGAHGGGLVQAHVAANLPQRAAPRARLLPLLAEDLRTELLDLVRADAAPDGGGAGAGARDLPDARGGVRPLRGAPGGAPARGRRPRQPPRRQVGAPPPRPRRRLLPGQPQTAGAPRRPVGGGSGGEVARHGVRLLERRGGGGRRGVVPGGHGGGHHARHLRPQLRRRPRRVRHAGPPDGLRLRGLPQGPGPRLPVLAHQEELAVVEAGQGDTAEPDPSHRPAQRRGRGRGGGDGQPLRRVPRPSRRHDQCRREEDAAGGGDPGGGHAGGMQDVLLRREADDDEPPGLGHRAPGHAPGVAGTRTPRGPRRLGPRRAPLQGAPSKAQDGGHDHKRDPAAVPAGGGHHPARQDGRAALQRVPDPARHGAADPDHGDPPRRQALGRRRGAVQPRAVRRRRGEGGEAPAGVHPVRAWRPGVHRPEPGAPGGPAHRGGPASAVRDQGVPELRPRAHGPDAPLPAVRRAGDLPATTSRAPGSRIIAQILRLSGCPTFFLSKLTGMPRVCHLPPGSGGPVQNDRNTPPATLCPCVY